MANDGDKGPITRSARDTLLSSKTKKKNEDVPITTATGNRKSERLEKRTPPSPAVKGKSDVKKTAATATASPLRRSERTRKGNLSSSPLDPSKGAKSPGSGSGSGSSGSKTQVKKQKRVKRLILEDGEVSEDEECDVGASSKGKIRKMDARVYRDVFQTRSSDCHEESNRMDRSTQEGSEKGGGKIGECFKGSHLECEEDLMPDCHEELDRMDRPIKEGGNNDGGKNAESFKGSHWDNIEVSKDGISPSEDAKAKEMRAESVLSRPVKELSENNATLGSLLPSNATNHESSGAPERDKSDCWGEETSQELVSRNSIVNENLISNCVGHDKGEKSISYKRKGTTVGMHSDVSAALVDDENCTLFVDADPSRLCGDDVGTSGSCSKRIRRISLSDVQRDNVDQPPSKSGGEKLSSGNKEERPQGSNVEYENIRKQQRSLHLLLKPEIAKLCGILLLPENVKTLVDNCLEYIMNNRQICTEPLSILQAFQLSLCWIAASLLSHKLDFEASLMLAKRHLKFDCQIDVVDEIYSRLLELKEDFLSHRGNSNVTDSPKALKSSNRAYSYTKVAREVKLADKDITKSTKENHGRENQLVKRKLFLMQQEEKQKLKADIEKEMADFERKYKIKLAAIRCCFPDDAMRTERLKVFCSEYDKRKGDLKRQHEIRLKDLEGKQLEAMRKFQEPGAPDELLNQVASKELGTGVEYLQTCDQAQVNKGPKNVAPVSDHIVEGKSSCKYNIVDSMTRNDTGVCLSEAPGTSSPLVVLCSSPVELQTTLVKHPGANRMDITTSEEGPISRNKCHNIDENEHDSQGNIIFKHSNSREQCSGGITSTADNGEGSESFSCESRNSFGQDVLFSSNAEICDVETSDVPSGEVAHGVCKTSKSTDDQDDVPSSGQGKLDGTILSKPCGFSVEVNAGFSDSVEDMASLNSQSREEDIPSITTMCTLNCENAAQIHEADDRNGFNNAETLNSPSSDERIASLNSNKDDDCNGSNNAVTLNSPLSHGLENVTAMNPPLSTEQISGGTVQVSVSDRELSRRCGTASPSKGPDADPVTLLNQPSLEKQNPEGVSLSIAAGQIPVEVPDTSHKGATVSVLERDEPVGVPSTVNCSDYPENVSNLNSSSMNQISDGGSVLDGVLSRPWGASSPSSGPASISLSNPPSSQQQISEKVLFSIPDGHIPVIVPEASHEVAECELTDSAVVDTSSISDQQDGVRRCMTEITLSPGTPVSRPVLMETLEQVQPLLSVESQPDQDTAREMQTSLVSSPVDIIPANQSNHVSLVMMPPEQAQQSPSAVFLSSNQDLSNLPSGTGIEHQTTNEDALSSHVPETASVEIPNQAVEQPASNLELDSHSHQVVVQPASISDVDSPMPGGLRMQSSHTINLSTPPQINNHPLQTAMQSASGIVPPLCYDPLINEVERIRKLREQTIKNHEDKKLQLKSDFEKEYEELLRKYEIRYNESEVEFQKTRKNLDTHFKTVLVNKTLAEAFRCKFLDPKVSGASGMQQDASSAQQLLQLSRQQNATLQCLVAGPSSCGPAAILQSSCTTANSQPMVPPIQAAYKTSGIFSAASARLPQINSMSSPSLNIQAGAEIRAPAPHLQPFRPSTSVPASSLCTVTHGTPHQPAPNIVSLTPSFSRRQPSSLQNTSQSDPRGHRPESTGGLSTPNLSPMDLFMAASSPSSINLPNGLPRMSDLASVNLSRFGTSSSMPANSSHQSASSDVVCLSDDE